MEKAINAYNSITVSSEFKELERLRAIARHNEASALRNAEEKAEKRIIDLLKNGKSPAEIINEYEQRV